MACASKIAKAKEALSYQEKKIWRAEEGRNGVEEKKREGKKGRKGAFKFQALPHNARDAIETAGEGGRGRDPPALFLFRLLYGPTPPSTSVCLFSARENCETPSLHSVVSA